MTTTANREAAHRACGEIEERPPKPKENSMIEFWRWPVAVITGAPAAASGRSTLSSSPARAPRRGQRPRRHPRRNRCRRPGAAQAVADSSPAAAPSLATPTTVRTGTAPGVSIDQAIAALRRPGVLINNAESSGRPSPDFRQRGTRGPPRCTCSATIAPTGSLCVLARDGEPDRHPTCARPSHPPPLRASTQLRPVPLRAAKGGNRLVHHS